MQKRNKCTKCRGNGKLFIGAAITKDDIKDCPLCNGTGIKPKDYIVKKQKCYPPSRIIKKNDGMEELKNIEAV